MGICCSQDSTAAFHRHYELEEDHVLGEGSHSLVFRGTTKRTREYVAIKRIDKGLRGEHVGRATAGGSPHWEQEVAALRLCGQHANVIELRDVFETPTHVYLISELAPGGELFQALINEGAYSEWDAKRFTHDMLEALRYLHDQRILHRDIKPENLLLTATDSRAGIKLAGFGSAAILLDGDNTVPPTDRLTWAYCSPEVLRAMLTRQFTLSSSRSNSTSDQDLPTSPSPSPSPSPVSSLPPSPSVAVAALDEATLGFKGDVWSVGVVLYVLLSGMHPFDPDGRQSREQMMELILSGHVSLQAPLWDEISSAGKSLLSALLARNPVERLSAEEALAHDWFTRPDTPRSPLRVSISDGLGQYQRLMVKKFRTSVLVAMAAQSLRRSLQKHRDAVNSSSSFSSISARSSASSGPGNPRTQSAEGGLVEPPSASTDVASPPSRGFPVRQASTMSVLFRQRLSDVNDTHTDVDTGDPAIDPEHVSHDDLADDSEGLQATATAVELATVQVELERELEQSLGVSPVTRED